MLALEICVYKMKKKIFKNSKILKFAGHPGYIINNKKKPLGFAFEIFEFL